MWNCCNVPRKFFGLYITDLSRGSQVQYAKRATVNIMDSRAMLGVDRGFYTRTTCDSDYLQFSGSYPFIRGSNLLNCRYLEPQVYHGSTPSMRSMSFWPQQVILTVAQLSVPRPWPPIDHIAILRLGRSLPTWGSHYLQFGGFDPLMRGSNLLNSYL